MFQDNHETVYETTESFKHDTHDIIACLTHELNILTSSYPEADLKNIISKISQLLEIVDAINGESDRCTLSLQCYKNDIQLLTSKLELEKEQRLLEMNNSFKIQDIVEGEKQSLDEKIRTLESALQERDAKVSRLTEENFSLVKKLTALKNSSCEMKEKNASLVTSAKHLSLKLDLLNKEVATFNSKPCNTKDKWVDDDIIDSYFVNMSESANKDIMFMGPAFTQAVKLSCQEDVNTLLSQSTFYVCKYIFLSVNNSVDVNNADSGTHWSLLFVNRTSSEAYHLDSMAGVNRKSAHEVALKIGLMEGSIFEIPCYQQNNGFECGFNVILNAKFINQYYCMNGIETPFGDWYTNLPSCLGREHLPSNGGDLSHKAVTPIKLIRASTNKWQVRVSKKRNKQKSIDNKEDVNKNKYLTMTNEIISLKNTKLSSVNLEVPKCFASDLSDDLSKDINSLKNKYQLLEDRITVIENTIPSAPPSTPTNIPVSQNLTDPSISESNTSTPNLRLKRKPPISAKLLNDGESIQDFFNANIDDFLKGLDQNKHPRQINSKSLTYNQVSENNKSVSAEKDFFGKRHMKPDKWKPARTRWRHFVNSARKAQISI
ncbi:SUMO1 sentrin specific peptidase 8 [Homalodisca vitripennis]|nr:SUMO1 sentrin specific peptidase 8 [Homalodisca vitripennis]